MLTLYALLAHINQSSGRGSYPVVPVNIMIVSLAKGLESEESPG